MTPKKLDDKTLSLSISTREACHIRYLKLALLLIGAEGKALTKQAGVDAQGFNYFEVTSQT